MIIQQSIRDQCRWAAVHGTASMTTLDLSIIEQGGKMKCIAYNGGYKYQLKETYTIIIDIKPYKLIKTDYISLDTDGNLTIAKGYVV